MLTEEEKIKHHGSPAHTEHELFLSRLRYSKPLQHLDIYTDKDVLDIGTGYGGGAIVIAEKAETVMAIDGNNETIQLACEKYERENILYVHMYSYELEDGMEFDTITFVECYEHMDTEELDLTIKKIYNLLKTNGYLYISTPEKRGRTEDFPRGSHWMEYTHDEVKNNVESYGFELEKSWKQYDTTSNGFLFKKNER